MWVIRIKEVSLIIQISAFFLFLAHLSSLNVWGASKNPIEALFNVYIAHGKQGMSALILRVIEIDSPAGDLMRAHFD